MLHLSVSLGTTCRVLRTSHYDSKSYPFTLNCSLLMAEKTLFEKIADREIPADLVFEDDLCIAFRDINPQAPTHILIVPRKPIPTLDDLTEADKQLVGHLFLAAGKIAKQEGLTNGYRTVFNCGEEAGQTVFHIHLHLLGGRSLAWPPG